MIPVLVLVPLAWCPACDSEMPTDHHCHKETST